MKAFIVRVVAPALLIALVSSCSTQPSSTGGGSFTADIDGTHFSATGSAITVAVGPSNVAGYVPGNATITGTQINSTTNTITVFLALGYIPGTGTYTLGVNQGTNTGGTLGISTTTNNTAGNWTTGFTGASGTVTITSITSTQIIGTFDNVTAYPQVGTSGASKHVTNGKFTVPLNGFTVAPGSTPGSFLNATTLGGQPFTGATVVGQGTGSSFGLHGSSISSSNVSTDVYINSTGNISPGSFPVNPPPAGGNYFVVTIVTGNSSFGGQGGDTGMVTITSNSGGRVKGTFSGTFGGLSITGGSFDVKLNGS